jgi:hypothetical protein
VCTPTSYEGGLTFLTGVDDQPNEIPIVVSAILMGPNGTTTHQNFVAQAMLVASSTDH